MTFERLLASIGCDCPKELCGRETSGIFTDSAKVKKNGIFVCIRGEKNDGHDYVGQAIRAGADVIVAENVRGVREGGAALTLVNNTRLCASLLYNEWFLRPADEMKIIGITGTNGKTSVASMLKAIFERAGYSCALIGTLGVWCGDKRIDDTALSAKNLTTPEPEDLYAYLASMRERGVEFVFMEVSSHALSQYRTGAIEFDCAVFTNLSAEHLDFHKDMESYYSAKEKLFTQSRRAVVNADDAAGRRLIRFLEREQKNFLSCSTSKGDLCALYEAKKGKKGIEYILKTQNSEQRVSLPNFAGDFQVMNSLEAIAVASFYGIPAELAADALSAMPTVCGRLERVVCDKQKIDIFIDYAHTPDALERVLKSLRASKRESSRIVLVFGCGGDRDRSKRREMGQIASLLADTVIVTSDNSRSEDPNAIIGDILKGINKEKPYTVIVDRRDAIEAAIREYTREGDILLLAGKGHERYEISKNGVRAFDEREIIRQVYEDLE